MRQIEQKPIKEGAARFSGIALVGSLVLAGARRGTLATVLGTIAVTASTINVVGGFMITDRMLKMFRRRTERPVPPKPDSAA